MPCSLNFTQATEVLCTSRTCRENNALRVLPHDPQGGLRAQACLRLLRVSTVFVMESPVPSHEGSRWSLFACHVLCHAKVVIRCLRDKSCVADFYFYFFALYREPKRASGRRHLGLSGVRPFDLFPPQFAKAVVVVARCLRGRRWSLTCVSRSR